MSGLNVTASAPDRPDELLDRQIDDALDRVSKFVGFWARISAVLFVIGAFVWFIFYSPASDTVREPVMYIIILFTQILFGIAFVLVQFIALFWFLGRTRVYWILPGETGVGFRDYKGNPEVLEVARRIVMLLRGVKHFKDMGGEVHRGLLLIGPPGTGKSYLAQCIATEAGVPFCYASAPSFQNMFMGMSNFRVMMLYGKARKLARKYGACIVFIDEIDAIGALRAKPADRPAVLTMGATNIAQVLDAALLRPGRFDWKITIDSPDFDGRKEVIDYYLSKVTHDPNISIERFAMDTIGYTPVAIKYVVNEAVVVAHFEGRHRVEYSDLALAMEMFETGLRQPINSMKIEDRKRIAYHEAGHAIAQVKLMPRERVVQLTIIRHGGALGYMMPKPIEQIYGYSINELLSQVQVSLAGKAAEQIYLGTEFTGASSDLAHATLLGMAIVGVEGMNGSLFSIAPFGAMGGPDPKTKRDVEKMLDDQFKKVKALLAEYKEAADDLVDRLIDQGDLTGDEVIEVIGRFEERKYGQRSPETSGERNEERMLAGLIPPKAPAGQAAAPHTDMFGWGHVQRY